MKPFWVATGNIAADQWQTVDNLIASGQIDPAQWANGIYVLRFTAWDLVGRTSELYARILIDSDIKTTATQQTTDALFALGGHDFALTRSLGDGDFGNWQLQALNFGLTHDQALTTDWGGLAA